MKLLVDMLGAGCWLKWAGLFVFVLYPRRLSEGTQEHMLVAEVGIRSLPRVSGVGSQHLNVVAEKCAS